MKLSLDTVYSWCQILGNDLKMPPISFFCPPLPSPLPSRVFQRKFPMNHTYGELRSILNFKFMIFQFSMLMLHKIVTDQVIVLILKLELSYVVGPLLQGSTG